MDDQIQLTKPNASTRNPFSRSLSRYGFLLAFAVASFGISPILQAIDVSPDGGESNGCVEPPDGLVSWWAGDKTPEDVYGTNPGSLLGGASFTKGMVGPGFVFDGINDDVKIPNSPSLSQTRITLDAWIYATGKDFTIRHIISKDNELETREYILGVGPDDKFVADVWLPSGIVGLGSTTTTAQLNTWYHVAMTHDGTRLRLYVNGVLDGTADAVGDIVTTDNPVGIGGNSAPVFFE